MRAHNSQRCSFFREIREVREVREIREVREVREISDFLNSLNSLNSLCWRMGDGVNFDAKIGAIMGVVANTKMSLTPFSLFHRVAPPCENVKSENFSVIAAYLLPLSHSHHRVVQGVQPFASNFNERCKSTSLTLKWCGE